MDGKVKRVYTIIGDTSRLPVVVSKGCLQVSIAG